MESFRSAMETKLGELKAKVRDHMTFTMQSPDFDHPYESTKLEVGEFVYRTRRIDEMLQNIIEKLNSNESLDPSRGLEVSFHLFSRPGRGGKGRKNLTVGSRAMEQDNKKKRSIITLKIKILFFVHGRL